VGVTLALVARAPIAGRCKTRLIPALGAEGAARLYEAMLHDSLRALASVGASRLVLLAAPEEGGVEVLRALAPAPWEVVPQSGGELGARLQSAMLRLTVSGDAVVFVGSDSPALPAEALASSLTFLARPGKVVLGPCDDGGYYLIGLSSPVKALFQQMPWSTSAVLETTRNRCRALGLAVHELPSSYDVDDDRGLARLVAEPRERAPRSYDVLRALGVRSAASVVAAG